MRTFKFAPTLLAFALALTSQYAHAWKSPQQAVDEFLKFELEGGRMQWPYAGEKYLISPPAELVSKKRIGSDWICTNRSWRKFLRASWDIVAIFLFAIRLKLLLRK